MSTGPRRRSYRTGGWFGIFGDHATVLLPPSEKARVAGIWELVDDGAGFDEVLDGLLATGLRDLPGFVLVSVTDQGTKVVLRGPAVAAFVCDGAMVELAGSSETTWVERTLHDVSQMFIQVEPTDDDGIEDLVIGSGLVRLARVEEPPYRPEALVEYDAEQALDDHPPIDPGEGEVDEAVDEEPEPPAADADDAAAVDVTADPLLLAEPEHSDEPTLDDPGAEAPVSVPDEPQTPEELLDETPEPGPADQAEGGQADAGQAEADQAEAAAPTEVLPTSPPWQPPAPTTLLPDQPPPPPSFAPPPMAPPPSMAPPTAPPPMTSPPPAPGQDPWQPPGGQDGPTRAGGWNPQEFVRPEPGIPGQPPAPPVTRPVARLLFSSGEVVDVDRAILVGRAPEARRFATNDQPRLVQVPSPHQEISSTHLEVRPGSGADHGTAVVTDLGSTNGTVLVQPGLPPEDLRPGIAVQLLPGAIIDLGDGVTIQVANV